MSYRACPNSAVASLVVISHNRPINSAAGFGSLVFSLPLIGQVNTLAANRPMPTSRRIAVTICGVVGSTRSRFKLTDASQAGSANANAGACGTNITEANGVAGARQRKSDVFGGFDNNNGKAVVGRVAFSPILGVEIGGSGHYGTYDPYGQRHLGIWAIDWTLVRGPFELIGESIWTYAQDNSKTLRGDACTGAFASALGTTPNHFCPQRMQGYYIQGNYHFLPEWLTRVAPSFFRPEVSTFTAMVRWEQVNTNLDQPGGLGELQRLTLGMNYRPTEDTVFKMDFQYSPEAINRYNQRIHDTAFILSAATYF